ncbi:MAG: hypothetical protein ACXWHZ_07020 [Usitatibacter sp.]
MRNLIVIALWVALGVQAADVASRAVDLDPPGVLEALERDKPEHYAKVLEMMERIQAVPYTPSGQMDLRREVQTPDATRRSIETSRPARTRLKVLVDDTEYLITVVYTENPATFTPVK